MIFIAVLIVNFWVTGATFFVGIVNFWSFVFFVITTTGCAVWLYCANGVVFARDTSFITKRGCGLG